MLAKTDIKNAFCLIPASPSNYTLLGIRWQNQFYFDKNLAMGLSSSYKTFECFSSTLEWIARSKLGSVANGRGSWVRVVGGGCG